MSVADRVHTISNKEDAHLSQKGDKPAGSDPSDNPALVQRCVIIQRDEKGYGLTVSGDNPVYVQSVKEGGAAWRAGVHQGDKIVKVNGTLVTFSNHIEVVKLIKFNKNIMDWVMARLFRPVKAGQSIDDFRNMHSTEDLRRPDKLRRVTTTVMHDTKQNTNYSNMDHVKRKDPNDSEPNNTDHVEPNDMNYSEPNDRDQPELMEINHHTALIPIRDIKHILPDDTIVPGFRFKPHLADHRPRSKSLDEAGSYVTLTLIGKPQSQQQRSPEDKNKILPAPVFLEKPTTPDSKSLSNDLPPNPERVTAPFPVDAKKSHELTQQKLATIKAMHEQALREYESLRDNPNSPHNLKSLLEDKLKTVRTLERMQGELISSFQQQASCESLTSRDSFIINEDNISMDDSGYSPQNLSMTKRAMSKHMKSDSVPVTIYKSTKWNSSKSIVRSNSDAQSKQRKFFKSSSNRPTRSESERSEAFSVPSTADVSSYTESPLTSPNISPTPTHLGNRPVSELLDESADGCASIQSPMRAQLDVICTEDDEFSSEEDHTEMHSPFNDLAQVEKRPAYMAVLLHYLISNSDPSPLFFYGISESFATSPGSLKDLRKWAYEIYSVFIVPKAPLKVEMDETLVSHIDDALMYKHDKEDYMRTIFGPARQVAADICKVQLDDFNHNCDLGLGSIYGVHELQENLSKAAEYNIIEKYLMPQFEHIQKLIGEHDGGDRGAERNHAMSAALVWFLRQTGLKSNGSIERCVGFVAKEKRSKLPSWYNKKNVNFKSHQFVTQHYMYTTLCNFCGEIIVGVGYQGYQCTSCELNYHRQCIPSIEDTCLKRKSKRISLIGDKLRRPTQSVSTSQLILPPTKSDEKEKEATTVVPQVFEIKPLVEEKDPDLVKFMEQGHSVSNLVQRYDTVTTPENEPQIKITSTELGRSESMKGRSDYRISRDVSQRRAKSDLEFDESTVKGLNNSGSSSASSLSASTSVETFSDMKSLIDDDSDFDVEPELPPTKQFVSEEVYKKVKPKEKKRLDVINELFYTERTHVRNLKVLDKVFYKPMTQEPNIPPQLVACLFPNLDEIIELHCTLSHSMKARHKETPLVTEVADLLLQRFDGEAGNEFRDKCAIFCRNQSYALDMLKQKQRRDERVNKFLLELENNPLCRRLQLKDLIPTVVHRLTKYPLLIENLCKYTQSSTEEHVKLELALQCSRHILDYVNQAVRECENHQRLVDLNRHIDRKQLENQEMLAEFKSLDLTQHKLLKEGPLIWRVSGQKLIPLHVVLLQDLLILFQKQDDKLFLKCQSTVVVAGKDDTKYTHSPVICLTNLLTRNVATDKKGFFLVNTSNLGPQIYELIANSRDDREKWFQAITDAAETKKQREPADPSTDGASSTMLPESQLTHGDPDQITLVRSQISVKSKRPSSSYSDSGLPPYSSSPERPDLDSPYDQIELTHISDVLDSGLIQPDEVTVTDTYIAHAQSVLTPLEKLRRNHEKIREGLEERQQLMIEILGLDMSPPVLAKAYDLDLDKHRDAKELVVSSLQHANDIVTLLTDDMATDHTLLNVDSIQTYTNPTSKIVSEEESSSGESTSTVTKLPKMPAGLDKVHLARMANRMNEILTNLMTVVNTRDDEREHLRHELHVAQEQLNMLRTEHMSGASAISRQRPKSMMSEASSESYRLDDVSPARIDDPVNLIRFTERLSNRSVPDESTTDNSFDEADQFEEALSFLPYSEPSQPTQVNLTSDHTEISPMFGSTAHDKYSDAIRDMCGTKPSSQENLTRDKTANSDERHELEQFGDTSENVNADITNSFVSSGNVDNSLSNMQNVDLDANCNTQRETTDTSLQNSDGYAEVTELPQDSPIV